MAERGSSVSHSSSSEGSEKEELTRQQGGLDQPCYCSGSGEDPGAAHVGRQTLTGELQEWIRCGGLGVSPGRGRGRAGAIPGNQSGETLARLVRMTSNDLALSELRGESMCRVDE